MLHWGSICTTTCCTRLPLATARVIASCSYSDQRMVFAATFFLVFLALTAPSRAGCARRAMSARKDWMLGSFVPFWYASSKAVNTSAARNAISGTEAAAAMFSGVSTSSNSCDSSLSSRKPQAAASPFSVCTLPRRLPAPSAPHCPHIPLQRVHRPPQAAGRLRIARRFLQLHRFFVQLLDEFPRAFEK